MSGLIDPPEGITLGQIHEEIRGLDKTIAKMQEDTDGAWASSTTGAGSFLVIVRAALAHAYGEPS